MADMPMLDISTCEHGKQNPNEDMAVRQDCWFYLPNCLDTRGLMKPHRATVDKYQEVDVQPMPRKTRSDLGVKRGPRGKKGVAS